MGRIIAVASGKGGTGKSTVSVQLAAALGRANRRVLLVDADLGIRSLDIMLSLTDRLVFDMGDVLSGRQSLEESIISAESFDGVSLLAAPLNKDFPMHGFSEMLKNAADLFDFVIVDLPAGRVLQFTNILPKHTEGLVVCNPDSVSQRAAADAVDDFNSFLKMEVRLVLNKVNTKDISKKYVLDIDGIIDNCGARLIAVIPEKKDIYYSVLKGVPLKKTSRSILAFNRFAKRIIGYDVPVKINKL